MARTNTEKTDYLMGQVTVLLSTARSIITAIDDKTMPGFEATMKATLDESLLQLQGRPAKHSQAYQDGAHHAAKVMFP